ncbi:MAG: hypothetical protein M3Y64_09685 [Gemmatimonadota bacterium]|nr:hypothetical protein [Gemmatimonadota bacterium]
MRLSLLLAALVVTGPVMTTGPFDIPLFNTPRTPTAAGAAQLVYASSPFGIAVTADGRASYDVQVTASGLPEPTSLGDFHAFVAWEVSTDLAHWHRLGAISNGNSKVGRAEMNKFLFVITAERDGSTTEHSGPTVLHGTSPSGWLQTFLSHPLFRGIPP